VPHGDAPILTDDMRAERRTRGGVGGEHPVPVEHHKRHAERFDQLAHDIARNGGAIRPGFGGWRFRAGQP
jgi:hypothetical protein